MQLLPNAAPGFDDPLGLMHACHERILGHCATLERLVEHLRQHGADAQAEQAASRILHYFEVAAPHHHADEEMDLFPLLRAHPAFPAGQWALLDELVTQHQELDGQWARLEIALQAIGMGNAADLPEASFVAQTRAHILLENSIILPAAAQCLDAAALITLGRAMEARRQK